MKVLHVIDSGGLYGAEVMLLELVNEQRQQGIDAQVCSIGSKTSKEKDIEKKLKEHGIPLYVERMMPGLNIFGAKQIINYARQNRFEIIHCHGYKPGILLGLFPEFMRQIPVVRTLHGWTSTSNFTKIYLYELLDVFLLKSCSAIVAVNSSIYEKKGINKNKFKKAVVIGNGISEVIPKLNNQDPVVERILKIRESSYVIGSIGRLSSEKGFDILLNSFSRLENKGKPYALIIIGCGELKESLMKIAEDLSIEDNVFFLGYQENASQYIPLMDVYVNSSRSEGMPITLLEAMRAGCPIVATDVGGVSEMLGHGEYGYLAKSENVDQIAHGIEKSIRMDSEDKSKIKEFFRNNFVSSIMAKKYKELYFNLIKEV